jgi:hypothetical protein
VVVVVVSDMMNSWFLKMEKGLWEEGEGSGTSSRAGLLSVLILGEREGRAERAKWGWFCR